MPDKIEYSRIQRVLPVAAGFVLIGATFILNTAFSGPGTRAGLDAFLVVSACLLIVLGVAARHGRARAALAKGSVVVLSVVFSLGLGEVTFRAIGFDFHASNRNTPIFISGPSFHIGDGILRRPGPASWRGRPLSWLVRNYVGNEDAYPDEQVIEIHYDRLGFRNPPNLADWEVVVTGDSFVESGYLPYEEIFTSIAAQQLGIRIKNLGVSGTGPIFQTAYVRKYGKATSTRHAVLSFYDGNDVFDLNREVHSTNYFQRTGHPWGGEKQTSVIVALQERLGRRNRPATRHNSRHAPANPTPDAVLVVGNREYPTTSPTPPPRWEDLKKDRQELVAAALANWGRSARSQGLEPWVMCIPHRHRVLDGNLRYSDTNIAAARWQPSPFGPHLAKICAELRIRFIDTFPALRREVEMGRVPYNLYGDAHLNVLGSRIVGEVLAEALRAEVQKPQ